MNRQASTRAAIRLLGGAAGFAALGVLALLTGNRVWTVAAVLLGALVGPVVYVTALAESDVLARRWRDLALAFAGGLVVVPLAFRVESVLPVLSSRPAQALLIALVQEGGKVLALLCLFLRRSGRFEMDGLVFGAATGMGFASLETALYGLPQAGVAATAIATVGVRALLSPLGHGTWTAIAGSSIWRGREGAAAGGPRRIVLGFALAVALHTCWDWQPLAGWWNLLLFAAVGGAGLLVLHAAIRQARGEEVAALFRLSLNPQ